MLLLVHPLSFGNSVTTLFRWDVGEDANYSIVVHKLGLMDDLLTSRRKAPLRLFQRPCERESRRREATGRPPLVLGDQDHA